MLMVVCNQAVLHDNYIFHYVHDCLSSGGLCCVCEREKGRRCDHNPNKPVPGEQIWGLNGDRNCFDTHKCKSEISVSLQMPV